MKKNYFLMIAWLLLCINLSFSQTNVFINEIHYENTGSDINEGIEISGPAGLDLNGYEIRFYNNDGTLYGTILSLSGIIPDQQNGLGTLWFSHSGIQNSTEGIALVDNSNNVIQFLSYEGTVIATEGPANGLTSVDISVSESSATPVSFSLQLTGAGDEYEDFIWSGPISHTRGLPNTGQTLPIHKSEIEAFSLYPNPNHNKTLFISTKRSDNLKVQILTIIGHQVFNKNVRVNEPIDISEIDNGVYFIRVEENGKIATRKLIVR